MGHPEDAAKWQAVHDQYARNFLAQLRQLSAKSEGYIPPGLDNTVDGNDWDNASGGLYPFEVLASTDPLARATLRMVRDFNYQEGIVSYGGNAWVAKQAKAAGKPYERGTLHHYETFYLTESNTILGEQRRVVEDLYSILAHTGSTNSGFEFAVPAWDSRDPGDNFTPHGWFASRFMSQVRDCLVREEGKDLHLASVIAPEWVAPGKDIRVHEAPTFFGTVNYRLHARANGATVAFDNRWRSGVAPRSVVFHLPWFVDVKSAKVDGNTVPVVNGTVSLPLTAHTLDLGWSWREHPDLSYATAVKSFLEKFYLRPAGANYDFLFPVTP
jgi:hypothetical protein